MPHMENKSLAKLERIKNYSTRYEMVMTDGDVTLLVCYTPRRNRAGFLDAIRSRGLSIKNITQSEAFDLEKDLSARLGNGWIVKFSGRTQREAIIEGEHTFIGEVEAGV